MAENVDKKTTSDRLIETDIALCFNQLKKTIDMIESNAVNSEIHCIFLLAGREQHGSIQYTGDMVSFKRILTERMCEDNTLYGCIHQAFEDAKKKRRESAHVFNDTSFHDKCWEVTKELIEEMIHIPYSSGHNNSFMIAGGNDRLIDVQVHGSYKTVSDILFEAAKKDYGMLDLLKSAYKRAEKWFEEHPIEPEYVEDDEYEEVED